MSLWEFSAAVGGYIKANSPEDGAITPEEAKALGASIDEAPVWH